MILQISQISKIDGTDLRRDMIKNLLFAYLRDQVPNSFISRLRYPQEHLYIYYLKTCCGILFYAKQRFQLPQFIVQE